MTTASSGAPTPILIAGVPRCGSSWIGAVLAHTAGVRYLREPDNEKLSPAALWAKHCVGRFPVLDPDEEAARYEQLWEAVFSGGLTRDESMQLAHRIFEHADRQELEAAVGTGEPNRALQLAADLGRPRGGDFPRKRIIVKSVHTPMAVEWLAARFRPTVLVVRRHPLNTLASWLEMNLPDRDRSLDRHPAVADRYLRRWGVEPPPPDATVLQRAAWQLGLFTCAMEEAVDRHHWATVSHEELSVRQAEAFRELADSLGLAWTAEAEDHLQDSNRPGSGYRTHRVGRQQPERWRSRLDSRQVDEIANVLDPFPIRGWPH